MRIGLSGSSGFIGMQITSALLKQGHQVLRFVRSKDPEQKPCKNLEQSFWDPYRSIIDKDTLNGLDAFINLSGENIARGRWSKTRKEKILLSRINPTRFLTRSFLELQSPPRTFLSASAVGFYGDCREAVDESNPQGQGFLAETCQAWEEAALEAKKIGTRVVNLRFGMVLGKSGGALQSMLPPFRLGLGGPIGDGRQYISWIAVSDALGAIIHCLENQTLDGPVNIVSPSTVTNREFSQTLASTLGRPCLLRLPAIGLKLALGELGEELLLASIRAQPKKLLQSGFKFSQSNLKQALLNIL